MMWSMASANVLCSSNTHFVGDAEISLVEQFIRDPSCAGGKCAAAWAMRNRDEMISPAASGQQGGAEGLAQELGVRPADRGDRAIRVELNSSGIQLDDAARACDMHGVYRLFRFEGVAPGASMPV